MHRTALLTRIVTLSCDRARNIHHSTVATHQEHAPVFLDNRVGLDGPFHVHHMADDIARVFGAHSYLPAIGLQEPGIAHPVFKFVAVFIEYGSCNGFGDFELNQSIACEVHRRGGAGCEVDGTETGGDNGSPVFYRRG